MSVGECAGGTTPPPHPRPQGSGPSEVHLGSQGWGGGECGKELVGEPRRRDGCGSPLATECGRGALDQASLYRLRSPTPGPLHPPQSGQRCGGLSQPRHRAGARQPVRTCSVLVSLWLSRPPPGIFPGTLLLSPSFSPHSSALSPLCMASVVTLPLSFPNVSETSLWVCLCAGRFPELWRHCRHLGGLRAGSGSTGHRLACLA